MWSRNAVGGGEGLQHIGVRSPTEEMGEGSLALWPMIKPDGHAAGGKRVELGVMTSGMWISLNVDILV